MSSITHAPPRSSGRTLTPPAVTLALWSLSRTWFLLLIIALGLISAIAVACTIPLYSTVTTTAGLRGILSTTVNTPEISLGLNPVAFSTKALQQNYDTLDPLMRQHLGPYMSSQPSLMFTSNSMYVASPKLPAPTYELTNYTATFPQDGKHLHLLSGRLPNPQSKEYEIILTADTASATKLGVGSALTLTTTVMDTSFNELFKVSQNITTPEELQAQINKHTYALNIPAHVVGIFAVPETERAYWHQNDFTTDVHSIGARDIPVYKFLSANELLLAPYDQFAQAHHIDQVYSYVSFSYDKFFGYTGRVTTSSVPDETWIYRVDPQRVDFTQFNTFSSNISGLQSDMTRLHGDLLARHGTYNNPFDQNGQGTSSMSNVESMFLTSALFSSQDAPGVVDQYQNRLSVVQLPVAIISAQIIALILFFISMMSGLLIERQRDTIAILRSRGASGGQVYIALLTQGFWLCVLALLLGPLLAMIAAYFLARSQLASSDLSALLVLSQRQREVLQLIAPYALLVALVSFLTLAIALYGTRNMDVLATRRESSRSTRRGLIQRMHLDIIAAIIALCGFGVSTYLSGLNSLLDVRTRSLISTPLSLAAPLFLVIAAALLFFRFYPALLNLAARLAGRGKSASSMLALAQISRSPGQSVRMILLLALALAFTIFTSVFTATQNQHAQSLASYEAGADFSGPLPLYGSYIPTQQTFQKEYAKLPGVNAASIGFAGSAAINAANNSGPTSLFQVRAVDTSTFASTAYWPDQAQLATMMQQLRSPHGADGAVPAYVDQLAWNRLNLHMGSVFTIQVSNLDINDLKCVVVGKVEHLPTINDSTQGGLPNETQPSAGVLVDYQTYLKAYQQEAQDSGFTNGSKPLAPNYFWLRTTDDAIKLSNLRGSLRALVGSQQYTQGIFDRRAIFDSLRTDPLSLNLLGILEVGTIIALLLAIVGDLLASLLSVRPRLANFAVLRALGTSPGQVASVLGWELSLIYATGVLLGILAGMLLSLTLVPNLVFSGVPNVGILSTLSLPDFYALQQIIPVQPIFPATLFLAFGVLVIFFFVALGLMVRTVSRPSMGQILRLNQD